MKSARTAAAICFLGMPGSGLRIVPLVAGLLLMCAGLTGCEEVDTLIQQESGTEKETPAAETETPVVDTATTNAETAVTMWPAYSAPDFFRHGEADENSYRENAISSARAAGLNCIKVVSPTPPNDEVAMHLLHFKSPVDGHFLHPSWYDKAKEAGVTRWIIDIGSGSEIERWRFLTKDYPANTIQWVVRGAVVPQF